MSTTLTPWQGDEIARNVQRQTGGRWVVWYGHHTGTYWAIPRGRYWDGHIEAANALELLARIGEVDAWFGSGGGRPVQPPRPSRRPGRADAVRVPRSGRAPLRRASGAWSLA